VTKRKSKTGITVQTTELIQHARAAIVNPPHQEQRPGAQAVIDHLQRGPGDALGVEGKQTEHDEAQMRHRGVGDQRLHIPLGQRDEPAVGDADDRQDGNPGHQAAGGVGEERQAEA
jgi:hypothetical protein